MTAATSAAAPTVANTACADPTLTVYYDGACPLCAREIATYQRQAGADTIAWVDVARCDGNVLGADLSRDAALARLHVRAADGSLQSGAAAFAAIWQRLPAWRLLARIASRPRVLRVLDAGYTGFLRVRRLWRTPASTLPAELVADLRTDHAGETGAVMIYRGVLAITRDPALRDFAERHRATEARHLASVEAVLPPPQRSLLLPLWRLSGWLTGALPALFGPRAVYATIAAVETFVDTHYAEQVARIDALDPTRANPSLQSLRALLESARLDEVHHRDEAAAAGPAQRGVLLRAWATVVGRGSAAAVGVCRRI